MNRFLLPVLYIILSLLFAKTAFAQPANDNCNNAALITISNNGYGLGTFTSPNADLTNATVEPGETYAPAIFVAAQNQKSVWYKFTLPTTRKVRVTLAQQGTAITAGDAGFTVYKTGNCLPSNAELSTKLTPIITFGNSFHPCVEPGEYLVQVSSKLSANGPVYIEVTTEETESDYDRPATAYQFGTLTQWTQHVDYWVQCQSLENEEELCSGLGPVQQYNKSTWHTFTTPAYFDYIAVMFSGTYWWNNGGNRTIGYKLYQGDAVANASALTLTDGCDSFRSDGYNADYKRYGCDVLTPNTTYTVQLFFDTAFNNETVRLAIAYDGSSATNAPVPVLAQVPASNQLGELQEFNTVYADDYLACNSRHVLHPCGDALPDTGIAYNGYNYNLSTFYTLELSEMSKLSIGSGVACYDNTLISLYQGNLNANCNTLSNNNLIARSINSLTNVCTEPGYYTIQFSGRDTIVESPGLFQKNYGNLGSSDKQCLYGNLGNALSISVLAEPLQAGAKFSLATPGAFDSINSMQSLSWDTEYLSQADTFGCSFTVLPDTFSNNCAPTTAKKVIYRSFNVADSGMLVLYNLSYYYDNYWMNYYQHYYQLYQGNANSLAIVQGVNSYPDSISGLSIYAPCYTGRYWCNFNNVCIEPGAYTLATITGDAPVPVGFNDQPAVQLQNLTTQHYNQATVQNMGSIVDSIGGVSGTWYSDVDWFSCKDNAVTIDGNAPCNNATKAIYRQFYLSQPSNISVSRNYYNDCYDANANLSLYSGQMSTAGITGLSTVWNCFGTNGSSSECDPLPVGWYTVVDYSGGATYGDNLEYNGDYGNNIGKRSQIYINISAGCAPPQFNRPYKAATDNGNSFLVEWNAAADTGAYPVTHNTVTLPTEHFSNCMTDTPFSQHPVEACAADLNRVAYYVFELTQESYMWIATGGRWSKLYHFDVRTDSAQMMTTDPVQPCIATSYHLEICKAQPGVYTLVLFAGEWEGCYDLTPSIYIDKAGTSRFDFAQNAYDFGILPGDSTYHYGAVGDVNPLNADRAPSHDFIYCTTGAMETDPDYGACGLDYNPDIYNTNVNNNLYTADSPDGWYEYDASRRNLWYTFVTDKLGWVSIKVENKSPEGGYTPYFAVYKSDVNATLPFTEVISSGELDSTTTQGLELVGNNITGPYGCCTSIAGEFSFYRDCNAVPVQRYYILLDNRGANYWWSWGWCTSDNYPQNMIPNQQIEVAVRIDTIDAIGTQYDHYTTAYDFGTVDNGSYTGGEDNYICATPDATDPTVSYGYCAQKTLWYKFTVAPGTYGLVHYAVAVDSMMQNISSEDVQLFRQTIPGDSTSAGLEFQSPMSFYNDSTNTYWGENCISPGTYYLFITGCNKTNQHVYPLISIESTTGTLYDHYSTAYDFGTVGVGSYTGGEGDYTCATADATDPGISTNLNYWPYWGICAPKTLWYTFTVPSGLTGHVKYGIAVDGVMQGFSAYPYNTDMQLFRQTIPGDSTSAGLEFQYPGLSWNDGTNTYWGENCVSPGTYYLFVTGCGKTNQHVYPLISIEEEAGDYCSAPMPAQLSGPGITTADVTIDCHTIGTDYGEFSPTLSCPDGGVTENYKSSWFRIDVTGTDTLDVTTYLTNNTNIYNSALIKYRMMTGDCSAMQEQSCVLDALTQNTYKCLAPGNSYYIQVFSPVTYNGVNGYDNSTGNITLNISAVVHQDTCAPVNNCLSNANFLYQFDCNQNDSVQFINYSTYGSGITYLWDFGYGTATSSDVSPAFYYPALATDATYTVTLTVTNTVCGASNTAIQTVSVPGRPYVDLGNDTIICDQTASLTLDATSFPGAVYTWQDGSNASTYTVNTSGNNQVYVHVEYNNCTNNDTINVYINPMSPSLSSPVMCNVDSIELNAAYADATYLWNNDSTGYAIWAYDPGTYWVQKTLNGCTVTDTFYVASVGLMSPLGNDTAICMPGSLILDATVAGATGYYWQDGSGAAQYEVTTPGQYQVEIEINGCYVYDTVMVTGISPVLSLEGDDTVNYCSGCAPVSPDLQLTVLGSCSALDTVKVYFTSGYTEGEDILQFIAQDGISVDFNAATGVLTLYGNADYSVWQNALRTVCYQNLVENNTDNAKHIVISLGNALYNPDNGHYYQLINNGSNISWTDARDAAATSTYFGMQGYLVTITSEEENNFIADLINSNTWIGASDAAEEGVWRWVTGCEGLEDGGLGRHFSTQMGTCYDITGTGISYAGNYQYWGSFEPNDANCDEDYAHFIFDGTQNDGKWNDYPNVGSPYSPVQNYLIEYGCMPGDSTGVNIQANILINVFSPNDTLITLSVCEGANYEGYTASGTYVDTFINSNGCDSIRIINLTVNPITYSNIAQTICEGGIYLGYNTSGTYIDTLTNANGCDSVRTLTLTVNPITYSSITETICDGENYLGYTATGVYTDTLTNANGCDSIRTLTLTVNPVSDTIISAVICEPGNFLGYTTSGTYTDVFTNQYGCDSTRTINLTVNPIVYNNITQVICEGENYEGYTTSGTYTDIFTNVNGCDSIRTINLTVNPITYSNISQTICEGDSYLGYSISGTYIDMLTNANGCDSIRTLTLTVNPTTYSSVTETICDGESYLGYTATGVYTDTLTNADGCDSIRTLTLTVNPVSDTLLTAVICEPGNFLGYTTSGTYTDVFTNQYGCDSTRTINLIVNPIVYTTLNPVICEGENYEGYTTSGTYTDIFTNVNGCDSIRTINLTVNPITYSNISQTICEGDSYLGYSVSGTYIDTLTNVYGCDSVRTLLLNVTNFIYDTVAPYICYGENYLGHTATGSYTDTLTAASGCDSILTVQLTVSPPVAQQVIDTAACGMVFYQGQSYYNSGIIYDTLYNTQGCDSIALTVNITVHDAPKERIDIDTLGCDSLYFEGSTYYSDHSLHDTLHSIYGCDSIYRSVNITIKHFDVTLAADQDMPYRGEYVTLRSGANDPFYVIAWYPESWFDNQSAFSQLIQPPATDTVMVVCVSDYGCVDTGYVVIHLQDMYNDVLMPNVFSPNGDGLNDIFRPVFRTERGYALSSFSVFNRWGERVYYDSGNNAGWDGTFSGKHCDIGVYFYDIEVRFLDGEIKRLKGEIHLVR